MPCADIPLTAPRLHTGSPGLRGVCHQRHNAHAFCEVARLGTTKDSHVFADGKSPLKKCQMLTCHLQPRLHTGNPGLSGVCRQHSTCVPSARRHDLGTTTFARSKSAKRKIRASLQTANPRFGNDPSAGSPTETLLRLLLPLNDQVWTTFRP